jgi:hypothetical protein
LTEVPKRAMLDREAEQQKANATFAFPELVSVPGEK